MPELPHAAREDMETLLLVHRREDSTVLALNRPEKRNALNSDLSEAIDAALRELEDVPRPGRVPERRSEHVRRGH